jgi:hypothetical protein
MRTDWGNVKPTIYPTTTPGITFTGSAGDASRYDFGNGNWGARINNDTAVWFPVAQMNRTRLMVSVITEESILYYYTGWIKRDSTESLQILAAGNAEILATAPDGLGGTNNRIQLHFGNGKLTVANRTGSGRLFNITIFEMG